MIMNKMNTYYFVAGKFNITSNSCFGYNYQEDKIGIKCSAKTFEEAKKKVIIFCTIHFKAQYKKIDMWYGEMCYPWDFEPVTEWFYYNDTRTNNYNKEYIL